ncbi:metal-dependent hydrolase [Streptomonospora wellingtoniae]|uniref:Metal-dependent hydrolase n=1 Tax=Streptomonospora wellingtoniae TaxID=3075544 RepID=A0ABU2KY82_9ACTN|nr:metal-dependent hydrolase [Streptomonospora sp. DSM 45055]MDT0304269.1 metal-dependent hydrolase [Streptomonospora sp. DSM 45055]
MMAPSHAATGLLTGVLTTAAMAPVMAVGPAELLAGAAIGAGAALLPDIDHTESTVARAHGPVTRGLAHGARWISVEVYRRTTTPKDTAADGAHRFLWHTPAAAAATGAAVGLGAALSGFLLGMVLWFTLGLGLLGLAQNLRRGRRRKQLMSWPVVSFVSALGAAALVYGGVAHGAHVGAVVAVGMLTGALGDGLTRSGVPLAWPFLVNGRRWAMIGVPRSARFSTGTWPERVVCWGSLIAASVTGLALV